MSANRSLTQRGGTWMKEENAVVHLHLDERSENTHIVLIIIDLYKLSQFMIIKISLFIK
ncbi:hypothetical protein NPIL_561201, partial [Nephila pilipes]